MNVVNERITVTIDRKVYNRLKKFGEFGETYTTLLERLLNEVERIEKSKKK